MTEAPVIETERLRLRPQRVEDFPPFAAFYATERSRFVGGPLDAVWTWYGFAADSGHWALLGFGGLTIEDRATGRLLGQITYNKAPHTPERELAWLLYPEAEGHGYAFEAALAARDHAYRVLGWQTAVSYIAPENVRSLALAHRLGASHDPAAISVSDQRLVFRHPAPEALQ